MAYVINDGAETFKLHSVFLQSFFLLFFYSEAESSGLKCDLESIIPMSPLPWDCGIAHEPCHLGKGCRTA